MRVRPHPVGTGPGGPCANDSVRRVPSASPAATEAPAKNLGVIVTFKGNSGKAATKAIERLGGKVKHELKLIDGLGATIPRGQLKKLRADPTVASVELDHKLVAFSDPNDEEYNRAWGVDRIGAQRVHLAGNTGQGVKLAIIDTGIDYIHNDPVDDPYVVDPEFYANYKGGYDFFNNDNDPMDDNGHGTHVAGIIAAEHNGYLVTGVAPGVDLYAIKILNESGEGEYSGLIAGLGWAVDHDMDIVNMSLGAHEPSAALQAGGSATCRTSVVGVCTVSKASIPTTTATVTFTVTGVTLSGRVYDGAANHDPDGDSTAGTSIVVSRP